MGKIKSLFGGGKDDNKAQQRLLEQQQAQLRQQQAEMAAQQQAQADANARAEELRQRQKARASGSILSSDETAAPGQRSILGTGV